eukprot:749442-Hanusia_phi.AAC.5
MQQGRRKWHKVKARILLEWFPNFSARQRKRSRESRCIPLLMFLAADWREGMSALTGKRIADDVIESPSKRIKQYFKDGFIRYGVEWANEEFAAGASYLSSLPLSASQQGTFSQAPQDIMLPEVEPQPTPPAEQGTSSSPRPRPPDHPAGTGMEVDTQKEAEWWEWWSKKWTQPAYLQVPNDLMR